MFPWMSLVLCLGFLVTMNPFMGSDRGFMCMGPILAGGTRGLHGGRVGYPGVANGDQNA